MGRSVTAIGCGFLFVVAGVMVVWMAVGFADPDALPGPREDGTPGGSPTALGLLVALTAPCGLLGGFVAAVVAGRAEVKHGVGVAFVTGAALALSAFVPLQDQVPPWFQVALPLAGALPAVLGGALRRGASRTS